MAFLKLKKIFPLLLIALSLISQHAHAKESRPDLTIVVGQTKYVLTENDFRQLHLDSIVVQDPVYNKHKRYAGYWLSDILALENIHSNPNTVWTFRAIDGYKARVDVGDVMNSGAKGFVAIEDLDSVDGWQKFQHGPQWISPGPYYLVWQFALEDVPPDSVKLPWPYQMIEISIDKIYEAKQSLPTESIIHGDKIFHQNCVACHSINLEGGTVGPELNVPKNILEYEERKFLKDFIGSPNSFRARSKMPSFNNTLAPHDIDDVLDYLAWMGKHKKPGAF